MLRYILTDLEGTTTSTHFVHKVLFPYFLQNLSSVVRLYESADTQSAVSYAFSQIAETAQAENTPLPRSLADCLYYLEEWTKADRKHPALKSLQGMIWREGYELGALKGHFYPDVLPALQRWQTSGLRVGIYSSGSTSAQRLLVRYSEFGDLSAYFSDYFDTAVGHKRQALSYLNILSMRSEKAEEILFLSDVEEELDAARSAGMQTLQLVRAEDGTIASSRHPTAANFDLILG